MAADALVIGGTGFLGSAIVRELQAAGWNVTSLARGNKTSDAAVPLIVADRSKPGELTAATHGRDFDLVVDCAAYSETDASEAVTAFDGRAGHYFLISTDFVYAAAPDARYPLTEDAPKQTSLPYAAGKLAAEAELFRAFEEIRFPATILRPPHILGAGKPLGSDPLAMRDMRLPQMIRSGEPIRLLADGQMLIQPVWNREIGRCIARLAGNEATFGQVFNCTGPDAVTALRYYEIINEAVGGSLRMESVAVAEFREKYPEKAHMARHRIYDLTKLRTIAKYEPQLKIEDAIEETLRWVESQT